MKLRIIAIVATIAMLFVPHVLAGGAAIGEIEKVDIAGIENFSRLSGASGFGGSVAGFGGATQPSAMASLKSEGFVTVVNLRLADEEGVDVTGSQAAAESAGLQYIHLPFDPENPTPGVVDKFLDAVGDEANQPVYIHCNSATRVAALWMIGRVLEDGWAIEPATEEVTFIAGDPPESVAFATAYLASQEK